MNKDLAEDSAVWRTLFGVRVGHFYRLFHVVKEPQKMVLRRILGPSLETGKVFDAVLSVNSCTIAIGVSVRAVQEKCDERKGRVWASCAAHGDGSKLSSQLVYCRFNVNYEPRSQLPTIRQRSTFHSHCEKPPPP